MGAAVLEKNQTDFAIPPEELAERLQAFNIRPAEYDLILAGLGRAPNVNELAMFSVLWSEHCCYKHSKHLLKTLPTEGDCILQGPGENAGVISVGTDADGKPLAIAFKIESHNHPTAVEPFQGAATGVGGILRDIFTMNARPIASLNALRFGPFTQSATTSKEIAQRNQQLLQGAVNGIGHYGNCVGVPTIGGEIFIDPSFSGNPLVNAMGIGLIMGDTTLPSLGILASGAKGVGNPVVYVGAETGKDGMGGAAFASKELSSQSAKDRPAVQVGDPFLEKLLIEACLEAFATGFIVAGQDMGAAGLTCSGAEMSAKGGVGMTIDLDKVPAREPNMLPHEYLLSESQERMLLVVEKGREDEVMALFHRWGLAACVVGEVVAEPRLKFFHHGQCVADVPPALLTDDAPLYPEAIDPSEPDSLRILREKQWDETAYPDLTLAEIGDWLKKMLASPNIARPTGVFHGYDRHVRNNTVLSSENNASGVIRLRDTLGRLTGKALAATVDGRSREIYLNAYEAAKGTVAESARNLACVGATPLAVTNNLNFGDPEKPEPYYHMAQSVRGMKDACLGLNTPVTGGNVSLYNERGGATDSIKGSQAILPSPVIGMVGVMNISEEAPPITPRLKEPGLILCLLGQLATAFGGGEYQWLRTGQLFGEPPTVDLALEKRLIDLLPTLRPVVKAMQDISSGGVLTSLTEMTFPTALQPTKPTFQGIAIEIEAIQAHVANTLRLDELLLADTHGSVVVACDPDKLATLKAQCKAATIPLAVIGQTVEDPTLTLALNEQSHSLPLEELYTRYATVGPLSQPKEAQ